MSESKRVILVSPFPFTRTHRGIDMLTQAFEKAGWVTHHLQFPNVFYSIRKTMTFETRVIEHKARRTIVPYVDSLMKNLPSAIFNQIVRNHQRAVSFIDWSSYDAVVLESGKPLFLLDLIPKTAVLIYRQSDAMREILGRNPDYISLEDRIFRQGNYILMVKERFRKPIAAEDQSKVRVIQHGFSVREKDELENPYKNGKVNAAFAGLPDLDWHSVELMCQTNPEVNFHIFGTGLKRIPRRKIKSLSNLIDYGFVPMSTYQPYLAYADLYVYPFKMNHSMKHIGLTAKFYIAMYYQLPIVCYPIEPMEEFKRLPVDFCSDPVDFADTIKRIAAEKPKREYPLPWDELKYDARMTEYLRFIDEINPSE